MWEDAVDQIMHGDFLLGLFQVLMAVIVSIMNLILYPFSLLIKTYMPSLDQGLTALADYFDYAGHYMAWLLDAFAVPSIVVTMVAAYYLFVFTVTMSAWTIKLVIKWKGALWG